MVAISFISIKLTNSEFPSFFIRFTHMQELKESFNYGLFCPPSNGKAGKFLDEERRLGDYPFNGPVGYLEVMKTKACKRKRATTNDVLLNADRTFKNRSSSICGCAFSFVSWRCDALNLPFKSEHLLFLH